MPHNVIDYLMHRYYRVTIANPDGSIVHHGDCQVFGGKVCTCGLLHDLSWVPDDAEALYPKYFTEKAAQDDVFEKLRFPLNGDGG